MTKQTLNNSKIYFCKQTPIPCCYPIFDKSFKTTKSGIVGPRGPQGQSDTITINSTITGEPGTDAQVIDITGSPNHILDFIIPRGKDGKDGSISGTTMCHCVKQMKNVLSQLITLYPTSIVQIKTGGGSNITGYLKSIFPSLSNGGLIYLSDSKGKITGAVSICSIATITLPGSTYNNKITYNQAPSPFPEGCDTDCEEAIRKAITIGEDLKLISSSNIVSNGTLLKNEYGVLTLVNKCNSNPCFVSICKLEVIDKTEPK